MAGKPPQKHTAADMRLLNNKRKFGTVENRDKTSPRGKLYQPPETVVQPQPVTQPSEQIQTVRGKE